MGRYSFSGHESFFCKPLWLKKGYDALLKGLDFASSEAVATLGVGKNMVASIRYWMKAFGLGTDRPTEIASFIFDDCSGFDPYVEDTGTLWLLHYRLVKNSIASIYGLIFLEFRRERKEFDRGQLQSFIKRKCSVPEQKNVYNENTVRKDIGVFLHNYVTPADKRSIEDFSAIFLDLGLIRAIDSDRYAFAQIDHDHIPEEILLFAIMDYLGGDNTLSVDAMQELSLIFGLSLSSMVEVIKNIAANSGGAISYTDNSGVKNLQFIRQINPMSVLQEYYGRL